jgi:hypothetical protein
MKCILCDQTIDDKSRFAPCNFHPGKYAFVFSTGADAGRYDSNMGYRDIYFWSCCGKREASQIDPGCREEPPLRVPGCATAPNHVWQANILITASESLIQAANEMLPRLKEEGLIGSLLPFDEFSTDKANAFDVLVFLLCEPDNSDAISLTQDVRRAFPDLPIVIFSEPDRLDGWKLQADSLLNISEVRVRDAAMSAIRCRYLPKLSWHPRTFFSYTRKDAATAERYVDELSRMERACWFDRNILISGVEWSTEISRGIQASDLFVLLLTPNTPNPTYCWLELALARREGKPVFVIPYDGSVEKLHAIPDFNDRKWVTCILKPSFQSPIEVAVDSVSDPSCVVFRNIPSDLKYEDELSVIWSIRACLQEWPLSLQCTT